MLYEVNNTNFLTIEEHRQIEIEAQKNGIDLMELAAQSITDYVGQLPFLINKTVLLLIGKGNNGGDGVSCAIQLQNLGYSVTLFSIFDKLNQNTANLVKKYKQLNGKIITELPDNLPTFELIIDAVIGIGISNGLDNKTRNIFNKINTTHKFVLAVDTPSGVDPFTGKIYSGAIKANTTLTFIGNKVGLHTVAATNYAGKVIVDTLI